MSLPCDLGANPNIKDNDSTTAFIIAAADLNTTDFLRLLLSKDVDVNYIVNNNEKFMEPTPLIAATGRRLESTKLLIKSGADVNYVWKGKYQDHTALSSSFSSGKIEIVHYLMLEAGVDYSRCLYTRLNGDSIFPVEQLRKFPFELDTKEYRLKMEIVDFLKEKGYDYWETPIPKMYYDGRYDSAFLEKY